jgi:Kef-type K+ transport system membrane component KefB
LVDSFVGWASLAISAIGGGALYAAVVLLIGWPLLRRLGEIAERNNHVDERMLSFVLMLLMLAAWFTDLIGIYAVFGAFILGTAMPRGRFAHDVQRSLEPVTKNLLLPLFFVYSGLNTRIGLINTPYLLAVALVVLLVACFGKGVACWLAARWQGEPQREALAIGALMNARGLMELILLNIGLEHGIITPTLFTVLVMMAILTTLAASPIFNWVYYRRFTPVVVQPAIDPA